MSREGAGDKKSKAQPTGGTPIWVWLVYGLGILGAAILAFSVLFTFGAVVVSSESGVTYNVSTLAIVLWGGLVLLACGLWI